jgi:CubicO group peptidase (beta-lactamase class C family)
MIERWDRGVARLGIPGYIIAIVDTTGVRWHHQAGTRVVGTQRPVTLDTRFYIASVTKPLVAEAVLALSVLGRLDLDAPVRRYLPRFMLADSVFASRITVRDLLAHKPGLSSWPITLAEAYTGQITDERFYRLLRRASVEQAFAYSNLHYTLLGRVIESITGQRWQEWLQSSTLDPLSLDRTTPYQSATVSDSNVAIGYRLERGRAVAARVSKTDRTMHAAGGLYSTASDLGALVRDHLRRGSGPRSAEVLSAATTLAVDAPERHPLVASQTRLGWGLGWEIRLVHGQRLVLHGGHFEGATAHVSMLPDRGVGVVVLANGGDPGLWVAEAMIGEFYDAVLGFTPDSLVERVVALEATKEVEPLPSRVEPTGPTRPLAAYVGRFEDPDWGTVKVSLDGEKLRAQLGDLPLPFVWVGPDAFIAGWDHVGSFTLGPDGTVDEIVMGMPLPDAGRFRRRPRRRRARAT